MFPVSSNTPQLLRLSVLKWLLVNRAEGCTINAINWAARRCPIVEILYFYTNVHVRRIAWVKDCFVIPCSCHGGLYFSHLRT